MRFPQMLCLLFLIGCAPQGVNERNRPGTDPEETDTYLTEVPVNPGEKRDIEVKGNVVRVPADFSAVPVKIRLERHKSGTEDHDAKVLLEFGANVITVDVIDVRTKEALPMPEIKSPLVIEQVVERPSDNPLYALVISKEKIRNQVYEGEAGAGNEIETVRRVEEISQGRVRRIEQTPALALVGLVSASIDVSASRFALTLQSFETFPIDFYDEHKSGPVVPAPGPTIGAPSETGESSSDPVPVASIVPVAPAKNFHLNLVAIGGNHTCTITRAGKVQSPGDVYCFGRNDAGQLGNGTSNSTCSLGNCNQSMTKVVLPAGASAISIAAGSIHTCALTEAGDVVCWGNNDSGQLGLKDTTMRNGGALARVVLPNNQRAMAIAAASSHTCALTGQGKVYCWGSNTDGRLGVGGISSACAFDVGGYCDADLPEVKPPVGRRFVELGKAFHAYTCGILDDGSIFCWGDNAYGQLGIGSTVEPCAPTGSFDGQCAMNARPLSLPNGTKAVQVSASVGFACALNQLGEVYCWGGNLTGQLGLPIDDFKCNAGGPEACAASLEKIRFRNNGKATAISVGHDHACAQLEGDGAVCWGIANNGRLASGVASGNRCGTSDPSCVSNVQPIEFANGETVSAIEGGDTSTCAITSAAKLICWGSGALGQLGNNSEQDRCNSGGSDCSKSLTAAILP